MMQDRVHRHRHPLVPIASGVFAFAILVLLFTLLMQAMLNRPLADFTRDPLQVARLPPYIGFLSNIGILLWNSVLAVCAFCAVAALRGGDPSRREPALLLLHFAAITAVLMLDDLFMFHEWVFPRILGIGETTVAAVYGFLVLLFLLRHARAILSGADTIFLALAFVGFGIHNMVEILPVDSVLRTHLMEDGAKLFGIAGWVVFGLSRALAVTEADKERSTMIGS
jgi:hypothetical protein